MKHVPMIDDPCNSPNRGGQVARDSIWPLQKLHALQRTVEMILLDSPKLGSLFKNYRIR
jgi:hypothetical protein